MVNSFVYGLSWGDVEFRIFIVGGVFFGFVCWFLFLVGGDCLLII